MHNGDGTHLNRPRRPSSTPSWPAPLVILDLLTNVLNACDNSDEIVCVHDSFALLTMHLSRTNPNVIDIGGVTITGWYFLTVVTASIASLSLSTIDLALFISGFPRIIVV